MTATARNAPCPCGGGKKYKLCCMPKRQPPAPREPPRWVAAWRKITARYPDPADAPKEVRAAVAAAWDARERENVRGRRECHSGITGGIAVWDRILAAAEESYAQRLEQIMVEFP